MGSQERHPQAMEHHRRELQRAYEALRKTGVKQLRLQTMPNWACTNYIATGNPDELKEFVRTLNTMPDLLKGQPFSFGRYWMGNLLAAFGMTRAVRAVRKTNV